MKIFLRICVFMLSFIIGMNIGASIYELIYKGPWYTYVNQAGDRVIMGQVPAKLQVVNEKGKTVDTIRGYAFPDSDKKVVRKKTENGKYVLIDDVKLPVFIQTVDMLCYPALSIVRAKNESETFIGAILLSVLLVLLVLCIVFRGPRHRKSSVRVKNCTSCGAVLEADAYFCIKCGAQAPAANVISGQGFTAQSIPCVKGSQAVGETGIPINNAFKNDAVPNETDNRDASIARIKAEIQKDLRGWGIGMILMGVLSFILSRYLDPLWGAFIIILGIINLAVQKRGMYVANGIALIILGVSNIVSTLILCADNMFSFFAAYGVFQIFWGIQELRKFVKYSNLIL